jgi:hypothetical protein
MATEDKFRQVLDGFCNNLNASTRIINLNLKHPVHVKNLRPQSASSLYPPNPYIHCPRIFVVGEDEYIRPQAASGGERFDVTYTLSVFINLLQIMGENNHRECVRVAGEVFNVFADSKLFPVDLQAPAIPGFQLVSCMPAQITYHSDLRHKYNDPNLAVSVAQVNFKIEGKLIKV